MPGEPIIERTLKLGVTGLDVQRWQVFLAAAGHYPGPPDGHFGPKTHKATQNFQLVHDVAIEDLGDYFIVRSETLVHAAEDGFDAISVQEYPEHFEEEDFFTPMRRGDRSEGVAWWQVFLATQNLHPYDVSPEAYRSPIKALDGVFGAHTEAQTRTFQAHHGLSVDGKVERETQSKAFELGALDILVDAPLLWALPDPELEP